MWSLPFTELCPETVRRRWRGCEFVVCHIACAYYTQRLSETLRYFRASIKFKNPTHNSYSLWPKRKKKNCDKMTSENGNEWIEWNLESFDSASIAIVYYLVFEFRFQSLTLDDTMRWTRGQATLVSRRSVKSKLNACFDDERHSEWPILCAIKQIQWKLWRKFHLYRVSAPVSVAFVRLCVCVCGT